MWPFSEMSLNTASLVGTIANWMLLASLLGGVLSTFVIVKTTDVKEEHWAEDRRQSHEKIADLETQGDKARAELGVAQADIAKANARIAEATARTAEAELKLEQLRDKMRPRVLKGEQFVKALEGKPKAPVEILFVRDDPECFQLATQIRDRLKEAKWDVGEIRAIESRDMTPRLAQYTSTMGVGGQPHGVTVVMRATSQADFDREIEKNPLDPNEPVDTARKALSRALGEALGSISGGIAYDTGLPGTLLVVVGPKPNLN